VRVPRGEGAGPAGGEGAGAGVPADHLRLRLPERREPVPAPAAGAGAEAVAGPRGVRARGGGAGAVRPAGTAAAGPRVRLRGARPGERAGGPAALTRLPPPHPHTAWASSVIPTPRSAAWTHRRNGPAARRRLTARPSRTAAPTAGRDSR